MKGISTNRRRDEILEILHRGNRVNVSQLAAMFAASDTTIRSDLKEMEAEGLLRRVHGGAVSVKKTYYDMSLKDRMNINKDEKIRIAEACAGLIEDGDTLMIDSGTTMRYLAEALSERANLTVVTNALLIAQEFVYNNSVNVILLGGHLDLQYQFVHGNETVAHLQKYHADKTIIATDGISAEHGLTTYHYQEAEVSRHMIERADKVIVAADYSKIGKEGFTNIAPIAKVDILVTNPCAGTAPELDILRRQGKQVIEV